MNFEMVKAVCLLVIVLSILTLGLFMLIDGVITWEKDAYGEAMLSIFPLAIGAILISRVTLGLKKQF